MKNKNSKGLISKIGTAVGAGVFTLWNLFAPFTVKADEFEWCKTQRKIDYNSEFYKELSSKGFEVYHLDKLWGYFVIVTPQGDELIDDENTGKMDRGLRLFECSNGSAGWTTIKPNDVHECGLTYGKIYDILRDKMKIPKGDLSRLAEKNIVPYAGRNF